MIRENLVKIAFSVAHGTRKIREIMAETGISHGGVTYHLYSSSLFEWEEGKTGTIRLTAEGEKFVKQYAATIKNGRIMAAGRIEKID